MKINIGTKNKAKIQAVREIAKRYPLFNGAHVVGHEVLSGVSDQPKSLRETIRGARNRARRAFKASHCQYGIGLESGLMKVPFTKTGYMDFCACAIYDGHDFHLGLSSVFEYPKEMVRLVFEDGIDITQAAVKTGLSMNPKLGSHEGVIGILTKGRLSRKAYTKQAIMTAMVHLENSHLY